MEAKLDRISELSAMHADKNRVEETFLSKIALLGIGRLLCSLNLEKAKGMSAYELLTFLCLFRLSKDSIHSAYVKHFYRLLNSGKNCFCRLLTRSRMDWRALHLGVACAFLRQVSKHSIDSCSNSRKRPTCYIVDDSTLPKCGVCMGKISRVFDHVLGKSVLGFKILILAFFDGKSTIPIDFSLHREKGKQHNFGLDKRERRNQFHKRRSADMPTYARCKEVDASKMDIVVSMIKYAVRKNIVAQYALMDSWFVCEKLLTQIRKIKKGAIHCVGLAKMGNTRYTLSNGRSHNANELTKLYARERTRSCRKYHCTYIRLNVSVGQLPLRIYLIRYGKNKNYNIMVTTDTKMSFVQAFELYQIRWNLEVLIRESKQYLNLCGCQSQDFDAQIADCTLVFIIYIALALDKRFSDYETLGELFRERQAEIYVLTLWQRILPLIAKLLETIARLFDTDIEEIVHRMLNSEQDAKQYYIIMEALQQHAVQNQEVA